MAQFQHLSIASKLNLMLFIAMLTVFGGTGSYMIHWLGGKVESQAIKELQQTNQQVLQMIEAYASALEKSAEMVGAQFAATLPRALQRDTGRLIPTGNGSFPALGRGDQTLNNNFALVDEFTAQTGAVATIFVRQENDFYRIATSLKKENGERAVGTPLGNQHPAWKQLMEGQTYTGKAQLFGRDYMTRYLPVKDEGGQVVAVVFIGIDFTEGMQALKKNILSIKIRDTGYVFVLETGKDAGKAVIHPSAEGRNLLDSKDSKGRPIIQEMLARQQGLIRYDWSNPAEDNAVQEKITAIGTFPKWGWLVGSGTYVNEVNAEVRAIQIPFVLMIVLSTLVLLACVLYCTRLWVSRPLAEVLKVTEQVAQGDLTVSIPERPLDEVGRLLQATNLMCAHLRSMIGETDSLATHLSHDAHGLALAATEVADISGEQSSAAAHMAAAIEEMSASIHQVSDHAQEARAVAEHFGSISDDGVEVIDQAIQSMSQIAHTVRDASAAVSALGGQSEQISQIVNVIREIADQTNLLALNAAIEAARAGEAGRGFAVVADEVRKLAERTTQSTQEISGMVSSIQDGSRNAVSRMDDGLKQVEKGVELANEAGTRIADIRQNSNRVSQAVIGISEALSEQSSANRDIALSVERIAQQAEHNHNQAQSTSAAATSMEQRSEGLRQSISRFRV